MDFTLSDDRRMLGESLSRFLAKEYTPARRKAGQAEPEGFSAGIWAGLAELGLFGALVDEAAGGFGGGGFDLALVFETLGRACVSEPVLDAIVLAGGALAAGNAAQRAMLEEMLAGGPRAVFAHYEDNGRYDMAHVATRAERAGAGWRLTGAKPVVRFCEGAAAAVVSARVAGAEDDEAGLALFLVPLDAAGVSMRAYPLLEGGRAANLTLENVMLPDAALIGEAGGAFALIEALIGRAILCVCAEALGLMESIKAMTLDYLRTRKQFGTEIGRFQALQHRMATVLLEIEQARSSVINAAAALDAPRAERERMLSAAKYSAGRIGALVAEEAIQMHGGIGMTWEYELGHFAKRLVMIDHDFGDEDHHLQRFIRFG